MRVVFDMDNTLTDEMGRQVRPGIKALLDALRKEGIELVLWTSSARSRAESILKEHLLYGYFRTLIFREDYDPERHGIPKDICKIDADFLVDDDPKQIDHAVSTGKAGFLIQPFRGRGSDPEELQRLHSAILAKRKFSLRTLFKSIKSKTLGDDPPRPPLFF